MTQRQKRIVLLLLVITGIVTTTMFGNNWTPQSMAEWVVDIGLLTAVLIILLSPTKPE